MSGHVSRWWPGDGPEGTLEKCLAIDVEWGIGQGFVHRELKWADGKRLLGMGCSTWRWPKGACTQSTGVSVDSVVEVTFKALFVFLTFSRYWGK